MSSTRLPRLSENNIDKLIEKIEILEGSLKEERKIRLKAEEELKNYKMITVPNLQKDLEEKELLCKSIFIEKINLEKEVIEKTKKEVLNKI
jgi:hypothetical protein